MKKIKSMIGILSIVAFLSLMVTTISPLASAQSQNGDLPHGGVFSTQSYLIGNTIYTVIVFNDGTVVVNVYTIPLH
jgi:hypothetical protein